MRTVTGPTRSARGAAINMLKRNAKWTMISRELKSRPRMELSVS